MTWSWSNLLLSCVDHNSSKRENLEVEGPRLCPWNGDASRERPLLLDPSAIDPQEHLEFHLGRSQHWTVQGRTELGKRTASTLDLDRPSDRYDTHLALLADLVQDLRQAGRRGPEELRALWRRKIAVFVGRPDAAFRSLTRCYLIHHLRDLIDEHELELPSLADDAPPDAAEPLFPEIPLLDGMGGDLVLRLLALGRNPRVEATHGILVELAEIRSWSLAELSGVLPQSVATLRKHVYDLVDRGELEWAGDRVRRARPPSPP